MRRKEFNGKLCQVLNVEGTVAKVALVGDISSSDISTVGSKYRVNCSQLVHPDDYGWKPTETEEQFYARVRAQKEFERKGWIY